MWAVVSHTYQYRNKPVAPPYMSFHAGLEERVTARAKLDVFAYQGFWFLNVVPIQSLSGIEFRIK